MSLEALKEAHLLIKAGNKAAAYPIIIEYVRENPTDYRGWWLLANAVERKELRIKALEKVLAIKPDHTAAQQALKLMGGTSSDNTGLSDRDIPGKPRKSKRGKNNTFIYIGVGILAFVLICGGISFVVQRSIQGALTTITQDIDYSGSVASHSDTVINRGSLTRGQSQNGTVDTFDDDGWFFNGTSGQSITIEASARDSDLDTELFLYNPSGELIANNDDIDLLNGNFDSRIMLTLEQDGVYSVVVSAFGLGGSYTILVR